MSQYNIYEAGFTLRALPINESDEAQLVAAIIREFRKAPKERVEKGGRGGRSKVMRFGWAYGAKDEWLGNWPPFEKVAWFDELRKTLPDINSISVNEYRSGDGIAAHIDSDKFDDTIYVLNLNADCAMILTHPEGEIHPVDIPRRTISVMAGDIRKIWKHGIPIRRFPRPRYSVVFRSRKGVVIPETA